jgi:predicted permease
VLVVAQIGISLLLVVAAGLFVRTVTNLHSVNLGFNAENILIFNLDATQAGYKDAALKQFYGELEQRFQAIPGVRSATSSDMPLVGGWSSSTSIGVPGIPEPPEGQRGPNTSIAKVGSTFFETMEIPILAGRAIDKRDVDGAPVVGVVNQVFAEKYFHGQNPVGRHFRLGGTNGMDVEIVGIARTARYSSLKREIPPVTYIPWAQSPETRGLREMIFELRASGDPLALANTVRQIVHQIGPQVPVADMTTQSRRIDQTIQQERTFAELCACFGGLALLMACVGLYGTMAYAVARRTGEIGIRMALGATRRRVVWMVLREVVTLSAFGLVIGLAAAYETTAFLKSFLFGVKPNDPLSIGASVAILIACALLAGYLPAFRASRIDPMAALRNE